LNTRIVVGISDAKTSGDPTDVIVTHALGSCIGVCLYDPVARVGGMLHYQLPSSKADPERARQNLFRYADTGMEVLTRKLASMGARVECMQVKIAGGAALSTGPQGFDIGKRNYLAIKKILWKKGMVSVSNDVGGSQPRHMYLNIADGTVTIKSNGLKETL
jgi:chemotaxis protein CheD